MFLIGIFFAATGFNQPLAASAAGERGRCFRCGHQLSSRGWETTAVLGAVLDGFLGVFCCFIIIVVIIIIIMIIGFLGGQFFLVG